VLSGSVTWGGFERRADPLGGASVLLFVTPTPVKATSTTDGAWRLSAPVTAATTATLTAWAPGFAPFVSVMRVDTSTELQRSFALEPLPALECVDTACTDALGALRWSDAPSGVDARGLVLEPGGLDALSQDTLLVAAAMELDGGTDGALRVRMPPAAWANVVDARPGTSGIEVPAATLRPGERAWQPAAEATLVTEAGLPIVEADLERIRSGVFSAGVSARVSPIERGVVGLFGGPRTSGCVEGTVTIDGAPAAGLTVFAPGALPAATSSAGTFCTSLPISSAPVPANVQYAGVVYAPFELPSPTTAASCGSGQCRAVGALAQQGERVATLAPCQLTVAVTDEAGAPAASAVVIANDDSLTQAAFTSLCGRMGTRCTLTGATDASGRVQLVIPFQGALSVSARLRGMTASREGSSTSQRCPTEPLSVRLSRGRELISPTATFNGSTISWSPAAPAVRLVVERAGAVVWSVSSTKGLTPPLTFGVTPQDATTLVPATGTAMTDDVAQLTFDGLQASGLVVNGAASAQRP
jgi:hypothetical protein